VSPSRVSDRPRLEVDRVAEPIVAWRAWSLSGWRNGSHLLLRPVARRGPWKPLEPATAGCRHNPLHDPPALDCHCGLHASPTLDILRRTRCPAVLGRVALWGRIVEHERGYRGQFAYPQRLALICQYCFWQWGPRGPAPDVVGWYSGGHLVPLCETHLAVARRIGTGPRRLLDAGEVGQALLDRYAVDRLAV
jgi:hypothetical protein